MIFFVPLYYNDGTAVESAKFQRLQALLLEQFEGLTYFPQPNQGFWKFGNMTFRDEIVIYRVISHNPVTSRDFLTTLKRDLKEYFQQEELLIIEREISLL